MKQNLLAASIAIFLAAALVLPIFLLIPHPEKESKGEEDTVYVEEEN